MLGSGLYQSLAPDYRKSLLPEPVQVEPMKAPVIMPAEGGDGGKSAREVKISVGFIDLMNHIAHAKAIDRIQPGYFQQYVVNLSRAAEDGRPARAAEHGGRPLLDGRGDERPGRAISTR